MATKKSTKKSAKKGAKKGAAGAGGAQGAAAARVEIDRASQTIARAVEAAIARQRFPGGRIRGPIIVGIWIDPITKKVQVINQLEQ